MSSLQQAYMYIEHHSFLALYAVMVARMSWERCYHGVQGGSSYLALVLGSTWHSSSSSYYILFHLTQHSVCVIHKAYVYEVNMFTPY